MPSWELHKKWADVMGISREVSQEANTLIDFGEAGHDTALGNPEIWSEQIGSLSDDGKRAFYLHFLLDEIARVIRKYKEKIRNGEDAIKSAIRRVYFKCQHWAPKDREIFTRVEKFVEENAEEIYKDIKEELKKT